jgi:transposase
MKVTVEELKKYGIKRYFILIDAGFFSKENLKGLYKERLSFLTRLPSSRMLYKELIMEEVRDLERFRNAVRYGARVLFIKQKRVRLFGGMVYAHIVVDPERKGREITKELLEVMEDGFSGDEAKIEYELKRKGIMILISSFKIKKEDVVPLYYLRQRVERLFSFAKDDLKLIPLRVHREETLRGYLLLVFITLIVFVLMKKRTWQGAYCGRGITDYAEFEV